MRNAFHVVCFFFLLENSNAQNQIPKIIQQDVRINTQELKVEIDFDLVDPDNNFLEVSCKLFNISTDKMHEEVIPKIIEGDVGFPISQGTNKEIKIVLNAGTDLSNLILVLSAYDREPMNLQELLDRVNEDNLREYLTQIQGIRNTSNPVFYNKSRDYITNQANQYLETKSLQLTGPSYTCINYEVSKLGSYNPSNIIIMDAHYDSAPVSPGADDNGSGVSGVLEAIRLMSEYAFDKTIRFLFFDLEELGLVGSNIYVNSQLNKRDSIKAVINYEMIGYYSDQPNSQNFPAGFNLIFPEAYNIVNANGNRGDFITNVANTNSSFLKTAFINASSTYVPGLKLISLEVPGNGSLVPDLQRSDHAVFWNKNIPAIMLTDGANFRNKYYHTPNDSLHYLNFTFMSDVVKAAIATMAELAGIQHGSSIEIKLDLTSHTNNPDSRQYTIHYAGDQVNITSNTDQPKTSIEVYNSSGKKYYSFIYNLTAGRAEQMHVPVLLPGIYFLYIRNQINRHCLKLMIND